MVRGSEEINRLCALIPPVDQPQNIDLLLDIGKKIYTVTKNPAAINNCSIESILEHRINHKLLRNKYDAKQDELLNKYNLKVPLIALLRADVINQPIEEHPLIKARETYQHFQPSKHDWQRFITLPTKLDMKEAELLGIIWADCVNTPNSTYVYLSGDTKHNNLYENIISPRIKEIFNLPAPVCYSMEKGLLPNSKGELKEYTGNQPIIQLCSRALRTWLDDDLGYPDLHKLADLLPEKRQKLAFVEGYIAGKATMYKVNNNSSLQIHLQLHSPDADFAKAFADLARTVNINARGPCMSNSKSGLLQKNIQYRTAIYGSNIEDLHLINPLHKEIIGQYC